HAVLHFDRAAHRVDHAAKFDEAAVTGAFDDASVMRGDSGIKQIAPQPPQPRQGSILIRAGEPAVADDIRDKDRCDFSGFAHGATPWPQVKLAQIPSRTGAMGPKGSGLDLLADGPLW